MKNEHEFIVWDEDNYLGRDNQFYTLKELHEVGADFEYFNIDFISEDEPFIQTYKNDEELTDGWKKIKIKLFNDIGKKDIDGNNIYAQSSIIEFDFKGFGETKTVKYKAVVEFDKFLGSYYFNVFSHADHRGNNYKFYFFDVARHITSLKIIDTIQENILGLISEDKQDDT